MKIIRLNGSIINGCCRTLSSINGKGKALINNDIMDLKTIKTHLDKLEVGLTPLVKYR